MSAKGGPLEARLAPWSTYHGRDESLRERTYSTGQAKEGASADSAEEMKDTTAAKRWRLHAGAIGRECWVLDDSKRRLMLVTS
jgi:hypothetical protein